jgi:hypothetical protein
MRQRDPDAGDAAIVQLKEMEVMAACVLVECTALDAEHMAVRRLLDESHATARRFNVALMMPFAAAVPPAI